MDRESVRKREMKFFPNFVLRELMAWYVALGVLGALAAIFPWNLGVKADPFVSAPAGIKPEWYFLFMFQTLKLIPPKVWFIDGEVLGVLVFGLVGLLWLLLPFFESDHPSRTKRWITGLSVFALAYVAGMSVYGILRSKAPTVPAQPALSGWPPARAAACLGYGQTTNSCLDCHSALPESPGSDPGEVQPGHPRAERV